jgi:hypothetical protein
MVVFGCKIEEIATLSLPTLPFEALALRSDVIEANTVLLLPCYVMLDTAPTPVCIVE